MKVILINPPLTMEERYGIYSGAGSKLPPLGLCNLAAVVRQAGVKVSIIDASTLGYSVEETFRRVEGFDPDLIGITAVTISIDNAANLAGYIKAKRPGIPIVLGGPHVTAIPGETMERFPDFDIAIIGEGEETFLELISKWGGQENIEDIRGIVFRKDNNIFFSPARPFINDLDKLPFPSWDLLFGFPKFYSLSAMRSHRYPSTSLITTRGCYGQCIFCDNSVFGRKIRGHSAEYVIAMIERLINTYGIKEISFYDDNFIVFPDRISKICDMIVRKKLDITWSCLARADVIKSIDTLKMLKEAGCWQICYGIESGTQKILDEEKKNVTLDQIRQVVDWTSAAGIYAKGFFMMGHPLETEKTLGETIKFAVELPLTNAHVTFVTPFPGSELHRKSHEYGILDPVWRDMNMWTPIFVPYGLTKEILYTYKNKFFARFYLRPRIIFIYLKMIGHPRQLINIIKSFFVFIVGLIKNK